MRGAMGWVREEMEEREREMTGVVDTGRGSKLSRQRGNTRAMRRGTGGLDQVD